MKIDLSTGEGYILASAMRGPDFDCEVLKLILTGPIRHILEAPRTHVLTRDRPLRFYDDAELTHCAMEIVQALGEISINHYLDHCLEALHILLLKRDHNTTPLIQFAYAIQGLNVDGTTNTRVDAVKEILRELVKSEREAGWWESSEHDIDESD